MFKTIESYQSFNEVQQSILQISTLIFNTSEAEAKKNIALFELRLQGLQVCLDLLTAYTKQLKYRS